MLSGPARQALVGGKGNGGEGGCLMWQGPRSGWEWQLPPTRWCLSWLPLKPCVADSLPCLLLSRLLESCLDPGAKALRVGCPPSPWRLWCHEGVLQFSRHLPPIASLPLCKRCHGRDAAVAFLRNIFPFVDYSSQNRSARTAHDDAVYGMLGERKVLSFCQSTAWCPRVHECPD